MFYSGPLYSFLLSCYLSNFVYIMMSSLQNLQRTRFKHRYICQRAVATMSMIQMSFVHIIMSILYSQFCGINSSENQTELYRNHLNITNNISEIHILPHVETFPSFITVRLTNKPNCQLYLRFHLLYRQWRMVGLGMFSAPTLHSW